MEFLTALPAHGFLQMALWTCLLASVACGVVGTYVVVRRITYIAGAISHSVLGGLGAAGYLRVVYGWNWLDPLYGAVVAALASAGVIGLVSLRARQREDTVIGAVWSVGMALGVLFIARTPGFNQDLMSYLFGNILLVRAADLAWIAVLDVVVVGLGLLFYHQFLAVCFDEEFARLRGLAVESYYLLLLALVALTVVLLVKVVGIVLMIALLTLPVAIAGNFARTLGQMMLLSSLVSVAATLLGLAVSYDADLQAGATIILLLALAYLVTALAVRGAPRSAPKRT